MLVLYRRAPRIRTGCIVVLGVKDQQHEMRPRKCDADVLVTDPDWVVFMPFPETRRRRNETPAIHWRRQLAGKGGDGVERKEKPRCPEGQRG
ncbi:hypothetical protein BSZ35_07135 [Salinibacter sp. 10B]|nr:hypothetical protein BSZ35_07135 [Salinibacter sp. 10B]